MNFKFESMHHIIIYDDHLKRPVYFNQKEKGEMVWYKVEGSCEGCNGPCCIRPPVTMPEFDDGTGKCKQHSITGACLVHTNKPTSCSLFPAGTPDHYYEQLRKVILEKCQLKITRL